MNAYASTLKSRKSKQAGFTLLELLVVVAILAAIAGTASIALKDTDARASAAAHVAMMDELNKGIQTYRAINRHMLPDRLDSLMMTSAAASAAVPLSNLGFIDVVGTDVVAGTITDDVAKIMIDSGITSLQYVDTTVSPCNAATLKDAFKDTTNGIVVGNIFMPSPANGGNGCGMTQALLSNAAAGDDPAILYWAGGTTRLTGQPNPSGTTVYNAEKNYAYLMTGIGPSSTLFDGNKVGSMTTVPIYRHVKPDEYNRFIAIWNVGTYDSAGVIVPGVQADLVAIVDGALDTKEEELGEWDGTRSTI